MTNNTESNDRSRAHWLVLFIAAAVTLVSAPVFAGTPVQVPVQGLLTSSDGEPVDGATQVTFRIYADATAADAVWESEVSLDVDRGLFDANLGAVAELDSDVFSAHPQAHLTITISGDEESGRVRLGAVPSAAHAMSADRAEEAHTLQGQTPDELLGGVQADQVGYDDSQAGLGADNTQAALEALMQRVEALEQDRQDLQDQVDGNESAVAALDSRVGTVETDTAAMQSQVASAESMAQANTSDITSLQGDVGSNSSQLATLQTDVSANQSDINSLEGDVSSNDSDIASLQSDMSSRDSDISALQDKTASMSATTINGQDAVTFDGVNVYVRNGTGSTSGTTNGTGNLIVGYGETRPTDSDTSGSHNIVVGRDHNYTSYGGFVGGNQNDITAPEASVIGGTRNVASDTTAVVVAGYDNEAGGFRSAVVSGWGNSATGSYSAILSGDGNEATASYSSVGGGSSVSSSSMYKFQAEGSIAP